MIDGISLYSNNSILKRNIENCHLLTDRQYKRIDKTGEYQTSGMFNGLQFIVYSTGRINILGSLHKYANNGQHNYDDFSIERLRVTLRQLSELFGPEILEAQVSNLEFGLNITTPCTANEFLKRCIILLRHGAREKQPITYRDPNGFKKGLTYVYNDYIFKAYRKGQQYQMGDNILRCEFKTQKMRAVSDAKIDKLSDLLDREKINMLFDYLVNIYDRILLKEDIDYTNISKPNAELLTRVFNPLYWLDLNYKNVFKQKKRLCEVYFKHAITDIKQIVKDRLQAKFDELNN